MSGPFAGTFGAWILLHGASNLGFATLLAASNSAHVCLELQAATFTADYGIRWEHHFLLENKKAQPRLWDWACPGHYGQTDTLEFNATS